MERVRFFRYMMLRLKNRVSSTVLQQFLFGLWCRYLHSTDLPLKLASDHRDYPAGHLCLYPDATLAFGRMNVEVHKLGIDLDEQAEIRESSPRELLAVAICDRRDKREVHHTVVVDENPYLASVTSVRVGCGSYAIKLEILVFGAEFNGIGSYEPLIVG